MQCLVVVMSVLVLSQAQEHKSRRPIPVFREKLMALMLPDNATAIRENIVDNFSCENRIYGYYADMDNDCQIFHVCLPQDRGSRRWSFICPLETVFNQETFVCSRVADSIPCAESERYYVLNEELGREEQEATEENPTYPAYEENELPMTPFPRRPNAKRGKFNRRGKSRQFDATTEHPEITTTEQ